MASTAMYDIPPDCVDLDPDDQSSLMNLLSSEPILEMTIPSIPATMSDQTSAFDLLPPTMPPLPSFTMSWDADDGLSVADDDVDAAATVTSTQDGDVLINDVWQHLHKLSNILTRTE
jgi:hypothetical protein